MEVKSAAFRFNRYEIPSFSFEEPENEESSIKLDITPNGNYSIEDGIYILELNISGFEEREQNIGKRVLSLKCKAFFNFEKGLSFTDIPSYFYKNAIAIVFPYIRAFISTLTLQANSGILILGLMNLSNLEEPLKNNTTSN